MHRTQILLEDWQYDRLTRLARQSNQSMGEIIRDWIKDKLGHGTSRMAANDPLLASIGIIEKRRRAKSAAVSKPISSRIDEILYKKDW